MNKSVGFDTIVQNAERIAGYDFNRKKRAGRLYGEDKTNRDFLIHLLWETGIHTNEEIGECFGLTYSSVSKAVSLFRH